MDRGANVWYKGELYEVLYVYESNYCEIRKLDTGRVLLIYKDELEDEKSK